MARGESGGAWVEWRQRVFAELEQAADYRRDHEEWHRKHAESEGEYRRGVAIALALLQQKAAWIGAAFGTVAGGIVGVVASIVIARILHG